MGFSTRFHGMFTKKRFVVEAAQFKRLIKFLGIISISYVPSTNSICRCQSDSQMPVRQSDASLFVLTVKKNTQLDPLGYSSFQCFSLTAFFQSGQPDDSWSEGSDPAQEYRMYFQFVQFLN